MAYWELFLLTTTVVGAAFGIWFVSLLRYARSFVWMRWGQRLCLLTIMILGLTTMLAALWQAYSLAPLGICTGMLVVAAVCETPRRATFGDEASS